MSCSPTSDEQDEVVIPPRPARVLSIAAELIIDLKAAIASGKLNAEEIEHCEQMLLHNAAWVIANYRP